MPERVHIRLWQETDSISELTALLHRSYKPLADMGLRFLATHQSDEITFDRISKGICYLAEQDRQVIGTATLYLPNGMKGTPWYERDDVAKVGQLAVEPEYQKRGIGSLLMDRIEAEVRLRNIPELALDTSEKAFHLIDYYTRRGYRFIEHVQWKDVNYRSVILSKTLNESDS